MPSAYLWPHVAAIVEEPWLPTIIYPATGIAGLWQASPAADGALAPSAAEGMMVQVDGVPVAVSIIPSRAAWGGPGTEATAAEGPQRVTSPMPGKIVKVLVKPGDNVDARQGLVVVEAMKMENELRARAAGTVTEVRVTEGSSVEAGAILVVLE